MCVYVCVCLFAERERVFGGEWVVFCGVSCLRYERVGERGGRAPKGAAAAPRKRARGGAARQRAAPVARVPHLRRSFKAMEKEGENQNYEGGSTTRDPALVPN